MANATVGETFTVATFLYSLKLGFENQTHDIFSTHVATNWRQVKLLYTTNFFAQNYTHKCS